VARTYLTLPVSFPQSVRDLAATVVGDASSPYDRARRLQDFFRSGEFTYDLDVERGHSGNDLERFLFDVRRGYCEQFAGAYAAMARAIGLPARVGVGFTPGDQAGPDRYSVRGYHGHAWPEVFIAGFGWIAFEPTPGRGIPGGEAYTGLPEAQASPGDPNTATTLATTSTTAPAGAGSTSTLPQPTGPFNDENVTAGGGADSASPWPRRLLVTAIVLAAIPFVWTAGVVLFVRLRRWRRRTAAAGGAARVEVAWDEAGEALTRAGAPPRPSETPSEFARRSAIAQAELTELAAITTNARYAPEDLDAEDELVTAAVASAASIERQARGRLDGKARLRALLDPRRPR
ncbi:MAG TPA: transglutaminase domain-containing protein, partial [Acidimicrobiales bacterium]|nr:transglutaminase domain-containing protein [Acidimicrobiales bacterium]